MSNSRTNRSIIQLLVLFVLQFFTAHSFRILVIPYTNSIFEIRIAERISKMVQPPYNEVVALLHSAHSSKWLEKTINISPFGDADVLLSALKNNTSGTAQEKLILAQIEKERLASRISKENYDVLVCNIEDPVCRYINHHVNFNKKVFYISACPKSWEGLFGSLPTTKGHFTMVKDLVMNIFRRFMPDKSGNIAIKYDPDAIYFSECFPPVLNPQPNLSNVYPVGSFLGESTRKELPDIYKRPIIIANKIILISLGADEPENVALIINTMKAFSTHLFVILSKTFDIGEYALGNVIVDENAPINDLLSHNKISMVISNGQWTVLLNAFYHNVPVITLGKSNEGLLGRELVRTKNIGIDLSQKKFESETLQEAIRDVMFDGTYKNNLNDISKYLKGLNNNYLIPPLIRNFLTDKESAKGDL